MRCRWEKRHHRNFHFHRHCPGIFVVFVIAQEERRAWESIEHECTNLFIAVPNTGEIKRKNPRMAPTLPAGWSVDGWGCSGLWSWCFESKTVAKTKILNRMHVSSDQLEKNASSEIVIKENLHPKAILQPGHPRVNNNHWMLWHVLGKCSIS